MTTTMTTPTPTLTLTTTTTTKPTFADFRPKMTNVLLLLLSILPMLAFAEKSANCVFDTDQGSVEGGINDLLCNGPEAGFSDDQTKFK